MKKPMRVHYDEEGDFLEIAVGKPSKCYATELEQGIFLRRDEKTKEIKSIEILGFKKRTKGQDIDVQLPVEMIFVAQ